MISGSDQYSLWCTINVKFAKPPKPLNKQVRYELNIDQATKQQFNSSFKQAMENKIIDNEEGYKIVDQALITATKTLAENSPKSRNLG